MKRSLQRFVVAVLSTAIIGGCASEPQAGTSLPLSPSTGIAVVESVVGAPTYATGDLFKRLKPNMELRPCGTINTDQNSSAYVHVNGLTSLVLVQPDSSVELTRMDVHRGVLSTNKETLLNLKYGTILCTVNKIAGDSRYDVHTPNGMASVRGTYFQVSVTPFPAGQVQVTYSCFTGELRISANLDGKNVTKLLASGQQWVPGEAAVTVAQIPPDPFICILHGQSVPPPLVVIQQPYDGNGPPNPALRFKPIAHGGPGPLPGPSPTHH